MFPSDSQGHQGTGEITMICNYDLTAGGSDKCWMLLKKSKNAYMQKGKCFNLLSSKDLKEIILPSGKS